MNKLYKQIIIISLFLPVTSLLAADENPDLKMATEKYESCLKTGHCELISSTLIHLMKMYYQYPDQDYSRIIATLDSISTVMPAKQVCMQALLTKQYLNGERDLDWMMRFSYEEIYHFLKIWSASGDEGVAYGKSRSLDY